MITTAHLPYHVCGAQQDGSTVCVPSEPAGAGGGGGGRGGGGGGGAGGGGGRGGAAAAPAMYSPGGAEPGYIAPDPKDPDVFFAGGNNGSFLVYTNRRTGQSREVHPYPRMFSGEPSSATRRTRAVDVPDRLLAGRSERAVHRDAARVEDDEQRHSTGRASAAT